MKPAAPALRPPQIAFDPTDLAIIERLQEDGRQSNRNLARVLGLNEGTVRNRIRRMEQAGAIRIAAVTNLDAAPSQATVAYVGIGIHGSERAEAAAKLREYSPPVSFVGTTLGRFDILCLVLAHSQIELHEFVTEVIHALPGVVTTETIEAVEIIKHTYEWVVLGPNPGPTT